jgi:hypothetical protein
MSEFERSCPQRQWTKHATIFSDIFNNNLEKVFRSVV